MTEKEDAQEVEEPPKEGRLLVSLSRTVGLAARTVADGLEGLTAAVRPRRPAPKSRKTGNVTLLVQRLGQIVSERGESDYEALGTDPEFWALIQKLQASRRAHSIEKIIKESPKTAASRPRNAKPKRRKKKGPAAASVAATESAEEQQPPDAQESGSIEAKEAAETEQEAAETEPKKAAETEPKEVEAKADVEAEDVKADEDADKGDDAEADEDADKGDDAEADEDADKGE